MSIFLCGDTTGVLQLAPALVLSDLVFFLLLPLCWLFPLAALRLLPALLEDDFRLACGSAARAALLPPRFFFGSSTEGSTSSVRACMRACVFVCVCLRW